MKPGAGLWGAANLAGAEPLNGALHEGPPSTEGQPRPPLDPLTQQNASLAPPRVIKLRNKFKKKHK